MTIKAVVRDHNIALPADLQIADGTEIEVILPEEESLPEPGPAMAWMAKYVGAAKSLPHDAAARHNELAHGRKFRARQ